MSSTAPDALPANAKRILAEVDKHTEAELLSWIIEAVQSTSKKDKQAIAFAKNRSWTEIESEIMKRVQSWDYNQIHELQDFFFGLGNVDSPGRQAVLQTLNTIAKDPKLEAYNFYRYFGGKPRIWIGLFSKI